MFGIGPRLAWRKAGPLGQLAQALDPKSYQVEVVHLGQNKALIADAERAGVKSVPALVIDNTVFHVNFGASIADLK